MKYKKIITSGCSFSDVTDNSFAWPAQLESYIKNIDNSVSFDHRGLSSQGQDLIQRKASHAIFEALNQGYKPDEIAVFVMWSSIDRKSFYIDNPDTITDIVDNWKGSTQGWKLQFADLKNNANNVSIVETKGAHNNKVTYNKSGGWLITSAHVLDEMPFIREYFMMGKESVSPGLVHDNLQNILMLQYLCRSKGIRLYQQFYMGNIIRDLARHKDHDIVKYLSNDLDKSTFISDNSCFGYLKNNPAYFKSPTDNHPNGLGHRVWLNEVILPKLEEDNFFE